MRTRQLRKPSAALILAIGLVVRMLIQGDSIAYAQETTAPVGKKDFAIALDAKHPVLSAVPETGNGLDDSDLQFTVLQRKPALVPETLPEASNSSPLASLFDGLFHGQSASVLDSILALFAGKGTNSQPVKLAPSDVSSPSVSAVTTATSSAATSTDSGGSSATTTPLAIVTSDSGTSSSTPDSTAPVASSTLPVVTPSPEPAPAPSDSAPVVPDSSAASSTPAQ